MSEQNTIEVNIERVDEHGTAEPMNVTLNWSDFPGNQTTVFDATVLATKNALAYLDAGYGYGSGWSLNSVGTWGPGEGYSWQVQIDGGQPLINAGLDGLAVTKEAGNNSITFRRVKA